LERELGGRNKLSASTRELIKRAAIIGVALEDLEARLLVGQDVDPVLLATLGNAQRRLLSALGLRKEPPPAPPPTSSFEDSLVANYKALASKPGKEAA
jgi:hypothetical protein